MISLLELKGVGSARAQALADAGIHGVEDLLRNYPLGYRNFGDTRPLRALYPGSECAFEGRISRVGTRYIPGKGAMVYCDIEDSEATLTAVWFHALYMKNALQEGSWQRFYGRIARQPKGFRAVNPLLLKPGDCSISPIYRKIPSVGAATLQKLIREALAYAAELADPVGRKMREENGLFTSEEALRQIHFPQSMESLARAKRSIAFEEMLLFQAALYSLRGLSREGGKRVRVEEKHVRRYLDSLPYALTKAQQRVIGEISEDLGADFAMARLVQGDVGSGKTAVAFAAIAAVCLAGHQSAMMAPTEILAKQHYSNAQRSLESLGIRCALLVGSLTAAKKRKMHAAIAAGEYDAVFGTHALISEGVGFRDLALAITDEQHRFGVLQRKRLGDKGGAPNVLVMSATPIPRTMSLVLYGDLDLSVIDELPPGRKTVKTHIVPERKTDAMWDFLQKEVQMGGQCYVVCPLVEESEEIDVADAENVAQMLRERFADIDIGLLHGRMKAEEKQEVLRRFSAKETGILVSTTVVEVGVDVPNATIMVILDAQRFGLAQLHQLRGRVGRGGAQSYCFLVAPDSERLQIMTKTGDGFVIAQKDLEIRGPGQLLGLRQSGMLDETAFALGDANVLKAAHDAFREAIRSGSDDEALRALLEAGRGRFDVAIMN